MIAKVILTLLTIVMLGVPAFGEYQITIGWDPSVNPYELGGYRVHVGNSPGDYQQVHDHPLAEFDPDNPQTVISNMAEDVQYYFAVTAYSSYALWKPYCLTLQAVDENGDPVYNTQQQCQDKWIEAFGDLNTIAESDYSNEVGHIKNTPLPIPVPPTNLNIVAVFKESARVTQNLEILYEFKGSGNIIADTSVGDTPFDLEIKSGDVNRLAGGGIEVVTPAIINNSIPPIQLINKCKTTNEITVEAWVEPNTIEQTGTTKPDRIVTLSVNKSYRNFTLGQTSSTWVFRIRREGSDNNGKPQLQSAVETLQQKELAHIVCVFDSDSVRIYKNSQQIATMSSSGLLSNWSSEWFLGIANEYNGGRPWLGKIHLVAIYSRALSAEEININFEAGF